jgi:hypothetical protein
MSASDAGSGSDTATVPQIPGFMRDMWDPNVKAWVSVPMDDPNATVLNTPNCRIAMGKPLGPDYVFIADSGVAFRLLWDEKRQPRQRVLHIAEDAPAHR